MSEHDELVRRLRGHRETTPSPFDLPQAADAIEALAAELDGLRAERATSADELIGALAYAVKEITAERDALRSIARRLRDGWEVVEYELRPWEWIRYDDDGPMFEAPTPAEVTAWEALRG